MPSHRMPKSKAVERIVLEAQIEVLEGYTKKLEAENETLKATNKRLQGEVAELVDAVDYAGGVLWSHNVDHVSGIAERSVFDKLEAAIAKHQSVKGNDND